MASAIITHSNIEGGYPGEGNIDADPLFVATNLWWNSDPPYTFDQYYIWPGSPCWNAGTNVGAATEDFEGDPRPLEGTVDIGADEYNPDNPPPGFQPWKILRLAEGSTNSKLTHCVFEYGMGVEDLTGNAEIENCEFSRNFGDGLYSATGTEEISGCIATENFGHGIDAGDRPMTGNLAERNGEDGVVGGVMVGCEAEGNGENGLVAETATSCTSSNNVGSGMVLSGDSLNNTAENNSERGIECQNATYSTASYNGDVGIDSIGDVSACVASNNGNGGIIGSLAWDCLVKNNDGIGIRDAGTIEDCAIIGNASAAVTGASTLRNSVISDNGGGIADVLLLDSVYVANNAWTGVTRGSISNSSIVGNGGAGVYSPVSITNSWIANNGRAGVEGQSGEVTYCGITGNLDVGARNLDKLNNCNISGNAEYDYQETRWRTAGETSDVRHNYWGPTTAAEMAAHPYPANIAAIYDGFDDHTKWFANYGGLGEFKLDPLPNAPNDIPPAFIFAATPNLLNAVNVGLATFTIVFSEAMNASVTPSVTFGTESPYTRHIVGSIGWMDDITWRGAFVFGTNTGDGLNTIKVSGAEAADGFVIPDDTSHQFVVDVWYGTGTSVRNGMAIPQSPDTMFLRWDASFYTTISGYKVVRSLSPAGPWRLIASLQPTQLTMTDIGLEPDTTYYYQVYEQEGQNDRQLTKPFSNKTNPPYTPTVTHTLTVTSTRTPTWTYTSTNTWTPTFTLLPSFTFTPTASSTPTSTPSSTATESQTPTPSPSPTINLNVFVDDQIDAKDLLIFFEDIRSGHAEASVLFEICREWETSLQK